MHKDPKFVQNAYHKIYTIMKRSLIVLVLSGLIAAQNIGTNKQEFHPQIPLEECYTRGNCQKQTRQITLDSNWRWLHNVGGYQNCYTGNSWDQNFCSSVEACSQNCALDGVEQNDWTNPYGIKTTQGGIEMTLVTHGQYGDNIGSRTYMMNGDSYQIFKLKNREFAFDVDVSNLPCGVNGALYFVEMEADGGKGKHPGNKAGAKYGTGYCDAQCPHDMKWIHGEANIKDWKPNPKDKNSGIGHYGTCCAELDIWEANMYASAFTVHPCSEPGHYRCEGTFCGDNDKGERQKGVCDKDGCDINSYRMGNKNFYGPGSAFQVDTTKPFQVVTQFITTDGTDSGDLKEVKRFFVQNGKTIANPNTKVPGLESYNSITDSTCDAQKGIFGETNSHKKHGGLKAMGQALDRGMVLVMSLWDDHDVNMLWLDSDFPLEADRSQPGIQRGPCSRDSGKPEDVEKNFGGSSVKYMNIRVGPINSTFKDEPAFLEQ